MTKQVPWVRIVAEGIAIVISILLAFAIQAWWEGQGERDRRDAILLGLASDLAASDVDLERMLRNHGARLTATERLMQLSRIGADSPELATTVDSLLSDALWGGTFDAPTGTLDALLSAGELDLLQRTELTADLTAWATKVNDLNETETKIEIHARDQLLPYLRGRIRTADLNWSSIGVYDPLPWELRHTEGYRLLVEPEFEGLISDLWYYSFDAVRKTADVRAALDRMRDIVSQELANRGLD